MCQLSFQKHRCSKYCMRTRPNTSKRETKEQKKRRYCRCGAGIEKTYGKCDTPGFKTNPSPAITRDPRGFDRVDMPRNNKYVVQASTYLCQGWRGNCDIQYLIYSSDGDEVDASDISRVTNYIVSYSCKGNETEIQEKGALKGIVMAAQVEHGDDRDVKKLARRVLNEASKSRVISKQEATCQLAGLDLYTCSEKVQIESLSGEQRLGTERQAQSSLLTRYAKREETLHSMNLYNFFDHWYNKSSVFAKKNFKTRFPLFTGARCEPVYPATASYARAVLLLYRPWHGRFVFDTNSQGFLSMFNQWIKNKSQCPKVVRIAYERAKRLKFSKEPTAKTADIEYHAMAVQADDETKELVDLVSTIFTNDEMESETGSGLDFGESHDWSKPSIEVRMPSSTACP
jgi:hypothetical protein